MAQQQRVKGSALGKGRGVGWGHTEAWLGLLGPQLARYFCKSELSYMESRHDNST